MSSPLKAPSSVIMAPAGKAPRAVHFCVSGFHRTTVVGMPDPVVPYRLPPSANRLFTKMSPNRLQLVPSHSATPLTGMPPALVNDPETINESTYTAIEATNVPDPQQSPLTPPSISSHFPLLRRRAMALTRASPALPKKPPTYRSP